MKETACGCVTLISIKESIMAFFKTVKDGIRYCEIWPQDPLLNPVFPECRVKRAIRAGRMILPPFIVFILLWSYVRGGGLLGVEFMFAVKSNWPMTIICILFILLMPLQGYWWMGKRSRMKLNPRLRIFYMETCIRLHRSGEDSPDMMALAKIMHDGIKILGREFLSKL